MSNEENLEREAQNDLAYQYYHGQGIEKMFLKHMSYLFKQQRKETLQLIIMSKCYVIRKSCQRKCVKI